MAVILSMFYSTLIVVGAGAYYFCRAFRHDTDEKTATLYTVVQACNIFVVVSNLFFLVWVLAHMRL